MALRLRQVVLVAPELGPALEEVRDGLGIEPCYHDPGVAEFGLENVLFPIGDQFLEIVAPVQEGTTAGRTLERRGGAGGYMVMVQCDDLDRRRARLADVGARVVWQGDYPDIRGTHVHPKDIGGAIVSVDEATPWESWRWAGPAWQDHVRTETVTAVRSLTIGAADAKAMAARWAEVLDLPLADDDDGRHRRRHHHVRAGRPARRRAGRGGVRGGRSRAGGDDDRPVRGARQLRVTPWEWARAHSRHDPVSSGAASNRGASERSCVVGVGDHRHRDAVVGPVDDGDRVAGRQRPVLDDAQVRAGAAGRGEALLEPPVLHAEAELEARHARRRDLEQHRPHPPALTDQRTGDVEARRREVLPHRPGRDRPAELL